MTELWLKERDRKGRVATVFSQGWLSQPKEAVKQCETRDCEFIPCAQYVIIRFVAASSPSRYDHCPAADKISCILHTVSYGTDRLCCTVRETVGLRLQLGMEGNQKQPELGYLTYENHSRKSQRVVRTMRDIPTWENSWISNR